jgi:hypothetical protein
MNFYDKLNDEQVTTTYGLFKFLERLRVIGKVVAHTEQASDNYSEPFGENDVWNFATDRQFRIVKDRYEATSQINDEEMLEQLFGRVSIALRGTTY